MTAAGAGCSAAGDAVGTVTVNLTGRGDSGAVYRLRDAVIVVEGPTPHVWNTEDDPSRTSLAADVEVGDYTALLNDGWHIERVDDSGAMAVTATLISDNPVPFTVTAIHRTIVPLQFRVAGDAVDLSQGYDITIGVQDTSLLALGNQSDGFSTNLGFPPNIEVFSAGASGNAAPLRIIAGLSTQLTIPAGIAVASGQLVVINSESPTISVYPVSADGNIAPIRQITGIAGSPARVRVSGGEIYAAVGGGTIAVFPLGASGNVAPVRTLENILAGDFALDQGELYGVRGGDLQGIVVYPTTGSGAQTPTRSIVVSGPAWCALGIAIHGGLIYVADACNARVVVLPEGASGTVDPVRVIAGPSTGLVFPRTVAIIGSALYVLDVDFLGIHASVQVYPLDAGGDVAPSRMITGTALSAPTTLTVF